MSLCSFRLMGVVFLHALPIKLASSIPEFSAQVIVGLNGKGGLTLLFMTFYDLLRTLLM